MIHYEERGPIALVTIDRPEPMGALDAHGYAQLAGVWRSRSGRAQWSDDGGNPNWPPGGAL